jgi:prophage antirepressor-like protein
MELIKKFNYEDNKVRVIEKNGEVYFIGKDIANILGYSNSRKALKDHVDEEDKMVSRIVTSGQNRNMIIINESGLYSLIFSSKLDKAKEFKRWVTKEVLPDIRKYGMYINDSFIKTIIDNPQSAREEMLKYFNESQRLQKIVKELEQENDTLRELENEVVVLESKVELLSSKPNNSDWKKEANKRVRQLTPKLTSIIYPNFGKAWNEVYREMLYSENINIKSKHTRRLKRMENNNVSQSEINNTTILDTIGTDVEYIDKMFNAISNLEQRNINSENNFNEKPFYDSGNFSGLLI